MTYNRKPCAALFLEPEYDALILEAYSKSRVTTEKLKNGRYPFSCIFCKEIHKDKNMTSYHRMFNLCKVYKEPSALKMYPTWEKSDHAELNRVAKKYGRDFALPLPPKPSAAPKRKPDVVLESHRDKRRHFASSVAANHRSQGPCKVSRSRVSAKSMHVEFQEPEVEQLSTDSDDHMEDCSEGQAQEPSEKETTDNDTPRDTTQNSMDIRSVFPDTESDEGDFRIVRHTRPVRPLTRKDVEERARDKAKRKFPDGNSASAPPPPTPVDVSALYTLLTEVKTPWFPKELLTQPQACLEFLHNMVEDGSLGVKLSSAFGSWYLYGNAVRVWGVIHLVPFVLQYDSCFACVLACAFSKNMVTQND